MLQPLIEIKHLKKYYPRRRDFFARLTDPIRAVDGVNLQIFPGEALALVGESGSGKTTLLHCLFRILEPTAGRIDFMGSDVWSMQGRALQKFRQNAQLIFQNADTALNPRHTIGSLITEPLIAHNLLERKAAKEHACELLQQVGLSGRYFNSLPGELSCGQRHRVAIARALALRPRLLVADEPFTSLDVLAKSRLLDLFLDLRQKYALTYFFVSHDLALVRQFSDRVVIMRAGRIVDIRPS